MFYSAMDRHGGDMVRVEQFSHFMYHLIGNLGLSGHGFGGDFFKPFIFLRISKRECKVFQLAAELAHAKAVCGGRVDFNGFLGDALLFDRRKHFERMQVVDAVREFNKDDPHVLRDGHEHFAQIFRLGMGELRSELEDLAFPFAYPEEYEWLKKIAAEPMATKAKIADKMIHEVGKLLDTNHVSAVSVHGRVKHLFSLYKKLLKKDRDLNKIYDMVAIRIIVKEVRDCYQVLGLLHSIWRPMPGRIKDYIAQPKPNGYQSLHTTI